MRAVALLALCLALGGCFSSERRLFPEERGQCPFTAATTLEEIDETPTRFVFEPSGAYCQTTNEDGRVERTLFVPIGSNWWIVQEDKDNPSYVLVHRSGSRFSEYLPKCEDFSADRLRRLGVTFDDQRQNCTANDSRQIETLFRFWRYGWFRQEVGAFRILPPQASNERAP